MDAEPDSRLVQLCADDAPCAGRDSKLTRPGEDTELNLSYFDQTRAKVEVPEKNWFLKLLAFSGPGLLMSIAMIDPGNIDMDIQAGSKFKYSLMWTLLLATMVAYFVQMLAMRLGVVSKYDLATACRMAYSRKVYMTLWVFAEVGIICADIPEVIGTAVALNLLFGVPLYVGVLLAALDTAVVFLVDRYSIRVPEFLVGALVGLVAICFLISMIWSRPNYLELLKGIIPTVPSQSALVVIIGLLGSLMMPHNLYLQSSLVKSRVISSSNQKKQQALLYNHIESAIALVISCVINISIMTLSGAKLYLKDVGSLNMAYKLLDTVFNGESAAILFAIALLASGQSSIITGTYAGQFIMEGYLHIKISMWKRNILTRSIAIVPAFFLVFFYKNGEELIILITACILAFVLPFSLIPLIKITNNESYMGKNFMISKVSTLIYWVLSVFLFLSNVYVSFSELAGTLAFLIPALFWSVSTFIFLLLCVYSGFLLYLLYIPIKESKYF